jgi:DNA topoisomerase VI subunit B
MRRLRKAYSREQPGFRIGSRVRLGTQSSLQKMRRANRPNSRTLQAHHLKSMAKKTTLKELGEMLGFVVKRMATKGDIADLRREMATKDDINRLDTKLTKFEEHEIDKRLQLEVRVTAIEKHLGLDKKIAA